MGVKVQEAAFDFAVESEAFHADAGNAGAVVTFSGVVRITSDLSLSYMEIEHYPGMTEKALQVMEADAVARFDLSNALIIHRFGKLAPGERIMMVATAARHRKAAFDAAEFLMDFLKSSAPFWKREVTASGANWVDSKADDEAALDRW